MIHHPIRVAPRGELLHVFDECISSQLSSFVLRVSSGFGGGGVCHIEIHIVEIPTIALFSFVWGLGVRV